MRTKRSATGRFHRPSLRSDSTAASRPLPPPVTDDISDDNDDSIELPSSSENDDITSGSSGFSDDLGEKTCLKCEKGGGLLCCSGIGCPIALHKECIVGEARYNEGKFHCPYCWYKLQEARREEWRIKVMLAKKDLTSFINSQPQMACGNDDEGSSKRAKTKDLNVGGSINEINRCENLNTIAEKTEPANKSQGGRESSEKEEEMKEKTTTAGVSSAAEAGALDVSEVLDSETRLYVTRLRHAKKINGQNADLPKESTVDSRTSSRKSVEEFSPLRMPKRIEKPDKKLVDLPFAHGKRRRVLWTLEEEEILREGVNKFATTANRKIPWRKIFEFGRHIFDPSRNPVDLKDKWRNISSKEA